LPRVGDYLASTTRPRYAYRVRGLSPVDQLVRWDPAQKTEVGRLSIEVDRVPLADVETTARIHPWRWDKRASSRTRSNCTS
jgi:hypothetical protein